MRRDLPLLALALALAGCNAAPKPVATPDAATPSASTDARTGVPTSNAALANPPAPAKPPAPSAAFDYYLLVLSWSPEYCLSHSSSPECPAHPGFVVHGMWPQNNNGAYPQHCSNAPGPTNPASFLDVLPTLSLIQHEWITHGTCSGLDANTYFTAVRTAFRSVKIPGVFQADHTAQSLPPPAIIGDFASANPTFPRAAFAVSCTNGALTAMEVCLSKSLAPQACHSVRTCSSGTIAVPPQ